MGGRLLVAAALILLAAHTLLATYADPGRSALLLPALAPLAVLAAIALVYARLAPGGRAVIAAAVGALALVATGLAVGDARRTFERPSDWTGFLLGPVGVALLALAATTLWRTRKRGGRRVLRRSALSALAVVGIYWLLVPIAMALFATHRPRAVATSIDLGIPVRQVTLRTADGVTLAAAYVRSRNGAAVISFPTRSGKLEHARMLARHGYGVLLVDMRGYDGSSGSPNAFGWGATRDIDAAVAWLGRQPDVHDGRIGGIGFSVGGEQMLEAAAANHRLRAVVSEGAGERSLRETMLHGRRAALAVPEAVVQTAAVATFSQTAPPPSLRDVAAKIAPSAAFFIYAGHGIGGEELNRGFYRAAHEPKLLWRIDEAGHTGGLAARPVAYERRVIGFLDRHLLPLAG